MLPPQPVTLSHGRVVLAPWDEKRDTALLEAAGDDEIWRWIPWPRPRTVADVAAIRTMYADEWLKFVVLVDGVPAGSTSYLDIDVPVEGLEIGGTWYRRDLWATDVNPTCKLLLMTHAFEDLGAKRVTLKTDGRNTRSQSAIKKLGCQYDGTLRHNRLRSDGTVRDTAFFSMLVEEWPAAKKGLLSRLGA